MSFDYSKIRYFSDKDMFKVLPSLIQEPTIFKITSYIFPGISQEEYTKLWTSFTSVRDFQNRFTVALMDRLIADSITEISSSNIERMSPDRANLFITNHRNIVLDSALLNWLLIKQFGDPYKTTAIAIGNNLLSTPWVRNLARINKSFIVQRDTTVQEMLMSSKRLSAYMRKTLLKEKNSIWIAQREGRTKDGNDLTQSGLLKMLNMSGGEDFVESFAELSIVPVAISYEYDPCDKMKLIELATIEQGIKYTKAPMEDFNSMFYGIMGHKGRVHYEFGEVITKDVLQGIEGKKSINEKIKFISDHIDRFIHSAFKLWPLNYIAADILNNSSYFTDQYTEDEYNDYVKRMEEAVYGSDFEPQVLKRIYLRMHANPVKNKLQDNSNFTFDF